MTNTIVIYNSQSGFTKRYAEWISQACGCECAEFKQGIKKDLSGYDTIVFGGWCMAGGITKLSWLKKHLSALSAAGKKIIVYAVGASPAESPEVSVAMSRNFSGSQWSAVKTFYGPGGLNYDKMKPFSKFMLKMFAKSLAKKKDATEDDLKTAEMISHSYDIANKKYIEPILSELKQ